MTHRRISGVVTPPAARVRRVDDYAVPRKVTRGEKLSGSRWNRATPVVVRRIDDTTPDTITPEELARNTYRIDGLGPYNELRGRLMMAP
jgi:hypothetical protein